MNRRAFVAGLTTVVVAPLVGETQPQRISRIGCLTHGSPPPNSRSRAQWPTFEAHLRGLGYIAGENILLEYRWGQGSTERLAELAAELVRLKVDVIVTAGTPSTQAAMQATTTIPIVMIGAGDPLRSGLVIDLARPGGNVTGNTHLGAEVAAKRLQLLKEILPNLSRVAFLWNPANASALHHFGDIQTAAQLLGVTVHSIQVREPNEFESAFIKMMRERPDALIMTADAMHEGHASRIVEFTARNRLPAMYQLRQYVEAGGLVSYGASNADLMRRAALYVDRILKGTKPGDLPVEQPTKFDLVINLKTAKALGLTIPPSLLLRADQVIE
jgi:putative ABC transport system substrate-binding protein